MRVPPALNASAQTAWRYKNRSFFRSNVSQPRFTARVGKPRDREVALQLGAAEAISLGSETASRLRGTFDTVIDTVGSKTQRDLFGYLRKGGVLISSVSAPDGELAQRYEIEGEFILVDVTLRTSKSWPISSTRSDSSCALGRCSRWQRPERRTRCWKVCGRCRLKRSCSTQRMADRCPGARVARERQRG